MKITLDGGHWEIGQPLQADSSGFAAVHEASSADGDPVVAKFVPIEPGAERELLLAGLPNAVNVVPILDIGEHEASYVLVMPRAAYSLRQYLDSRGGFVDPDEAAEILTDIAVALDGLASQSDGVVHRDLKPANVLYLEGHWCLADFGISRYADAATATATRKFSLTPPYASPEQWRMEHAEHSSDIYSFGCIGYELITGTPPFPGPDADSYRLQHLSDAPAPLTVGSPRLRGLIAGCLLKAPRSRLSASEVLHRLIQETSHAPRSGGPSKLADVSDQVRAVRAEYDRQESLAETRRLQRLELFETAKQVYEAIHPVLLQVIQDDAPEAHISIGPARTQEWTAELNAGAMGMSAAVAAGEHWDGPFDVIATAVISVTCSRRVGGYRGRSHSLWYCDAQVEGRYRWFEVAFMDSPFASGRTDHEPYSMEPSPHAAQALSGVIGGIQLAWPFLEVDPTDLQPFTDRWIDWFASAAQGALEHPPAMPERDTAGSHRR